MQGLSEKIAQACESLRGQWTGAPQIGLILGTGLGGLADEIEADVKIPYAEIPHFPTSTVESHAGQLVCGTLRGRPVVAMEGRFHYYEGYSLQEIAVPKSWTGRTLIELAARRTHEIQIVGVRDSLTGTLRVPPRPTDTLKPSDSMLLAGADDALEQIRSASR